MEDVPDNDGWYYRGSFHFSFFLIRLFFVIIALLGVIWSSRYVYVNGNLSTLGLGGYIGSQMIAGLLFWWLLRARGSRLKAMSKTSVVFGLIVLAGFGVRVISFGFRPSMESDYYRFLWDGAVTAHGLNPYRHAPKNILDRLSTEKGGGKKETAGHEQIEPKPTHTAKERVGVLYLEIGERGREVLKRINAPGVRTIYPPVTQLLLAVAHVLSPFRTTGLRLLYLFFDLIGLILLYFLFRTFSMSPILTSVYWLNPIVIRQIYQGLHMEVLLFPILLLAIYLAYRRMVIGSLVVLVLAVGMKIWPVVLLPLFVRYFWSDKQSLIISVPVVLIGFGVLSYLMMVKPLEPDAGWLAYGRHWRSHAGLYSIFLHGAQWLSMQGLKFGMVPAVVAKACSAFCVGGVLVWFLWEPITTERDLIVNSFWIVFWLFVLIPSPFPWYVLWFVPFFAFYQVLPVFLLYVLLPVFDSQIYFITKGNRYFYEHGVVWIVWGPVLLSTIGLLFKRKKGNVVRTFFERFDFTS